MGNNIQWRTTNRVGRIEPLLTYKFRSTRCARTQYKRRSMSVWRMNGGCIVLLDRDHDLLCEREPVGDSRGSCVENGPSA